MKWNLPVPHPDKELLMEKFNRIGIENENDMTEAEREEYGLPDNKPYADFILSWKPSGDSP